VENLAKAKTDYGKPNNDEEKLRKTNEKTNNNYGQPEEQLRTAKARKKLRQSKENL